jgi:hypothetical protein
MYKESDIIACAQDLNAILLRQPKSKARAITKKYSSSRLLSVALIPPVEEL